MDMLSCSYCGKQYIRKSALNNHLITCKFNMICKQSDLYDSNNNLNLRSVSNNDIYKLLVDLHNKYEKLQNDYDEIKKFVNISKNKIDIVDYLNQNYKCDKFDLNYFISQLTFSMDDLHIVFKQNFVEGIMQILTKNIESYKNQNHDHNQNHNLILPIKAFVHKDNILYVYSENEWKVISNQEWDNFIKYFDKKLLTMFLQWKEETEMVMKSEEFSRLYPVYMKKVLSSSYENKNRNSIIKNKLYKLLKVNIKNIVAYEFE